MNKADSHDVIRVQGARVNNLKDVSVELAKRRLTVFTGVSGSGKSSLVFDTIAAESQRLINETYSAFVQGFMASLARPDVDVLDGLTTAIIVDQERMGANVRSTVGTATDANTMLRMLFSRLGQPHIGPPSAFAFNVPTSIVSGVMEIERGKVSEKKVVREERYIGGMCPRCEGMGTASDIDLSELYDESKSLNDGPFKIPGYKAGGWAVREFAESGFLDPAKPIAKYTKKELHDFLHKEPTKIKFAGINRTYEGLIARVEKSFLSKDPESLKPHIREFVERAVTFTECPDCGGTRLSESARSSKIEGINIADACAMQISDLAEWVRGLDQPSVAPLLAVLQHTLDSVVEIGLGYLSLDRPAGTLSGGEAQRTKMIRHLGSALTDVTYVFDEPTIGLHAHDVERTNTLLRSLRDKGNTVLVVEHDPEVMQIADHLIDIGPGAGTHGGEIVYQGDFAGLSASKTATGKQLERRPSLKETVREASGAIPIRKARLHNLQDVSVDVPLGVLVAVTGVAGSGKSSLIDGCLPRTDPSVTVVDQSQIQGSRRSNLATYSGIADPIRRAFAKANDVKPSLFSSNSEGACPECKGLGLIYTELGFMDTVVTVCELCEGRRFDASVLEYQLRGKHIAEVLDMPTEQAAEFFSEEKAAGVMLGRLVDVGLGYIQLGQTLDTFSAGERQRLKLAIEMGTDTEVCVLDEPTVGLHLKDVDQLLALLDQLVEGGRTVIVIEHNLDVVAHADWVIDMGPGAGHDGGQVVFEGTPAELVQAGTITGRHLGRRLSGD